MVKSTCDREDMSVGDSPSLQGRHGVFACITPTLWKKWRVETGGLLGLADSQPSCKTQFHVQGQMLPPRNKTEGNRGHLVPSSSIYACTQVLASLTHTPHVHTHKHTHAQQESS